MSSIRDEMRALESIPQEVDGDEPVASVDKPKRKIDWGIVIAAACVLGAASWWQWSEQIKKLLGL